MGGVQTSGRLTLGAKKIVDVASEGANLSVEVSNLEHGQFKGLQSEREKSSQLSALIS